MESKVIKAFKTIEKNDKEIEEAELIVDDPQTDKDILMMQQTNQVLSMAIISYLMKCYKLEYKEVVAVDLGEEKYGGE